MDIRGFHYFNAVFEEKSIREAARRLFISPQGLGKIIRTMEGEFNTTFFERTKNGLVPTKSGVLFYKWSKEFTDSMNVLRDQISELDSSVQTLRVAWANGVSKAFSMDKIMGIIREYENVDVKLFEYENNELPDKLISSEIDFALSVGKIDDRRIEQDVLLRLQLGLLVFEGHPFWDMECISVDMLRGLPLVSMNEKFRIYQELRDICLAEGFEPNIRLVAADGQTMGRFCMQKLGAAFTPKFPSVEENGLRFIPFDNDGLTWDIYGSWLTGKHDMAVVKVARDYFRG